jgi:pantetheine-phosphate adenylyltransferase
MSISHIPDNYHTQSFAYQMQHEKELFHQYQKTDYPSYLKQRLDALEKHPLSAGLNAIIDFLKNRKPNIAVFAGSFNPFHKGHFNVLTKAERIFDKVIIAFGSNPSKTDKKWPVPQQIQNRQCANYEGLLTDFIDSLGYEVTVIRGLRNSTDFQYEQNQYRYIQELKPDIKIINIFCDKEFEHISSSGIRTLEKFNRHHQYLLD